MRQLSKHEALDLLTFVVDGEAGDGEIEAFLHYIRSDDELNRIYFGMCRVKQAVRTHIVRTPAPERLRRRIHNWLEVQEGRNGSGSEWK